MRKVILGILLSAVAGLAALSSVTLPNENIDAGNPPQVIWVDQNFDSLKIGTNRIVDTVRGLQAGTAGFSNLTALMPVYANASKRLTSGTFTGTGTEFVLGTAPTISGATLSGTTILSGDLEIASTRASFVTGTADPFIYRSSDAGSLPFTQNGHLMIQGRSDQNRSIFFVTGATPAVRYEIDGVGGHSITGAVTTSSTLGVTGAVTADSLISAKVHDFGSFTATLTGVTTTVTATIHWERIFKQVTIMVPQIIGTSNSTSCTITGMPAGIHPARRVGFSTSTIMDNTAVSGSALQGVYVETTGTLTLVWLGLTTGFTSSGTKGFLASIDQNNTTASFPFTYTIQ